MRGIERLVAGALLVMAVTGTAVLARTSAPGGGHAQALQLQRPPRSDVVAPLPVVIPASEAPARRIVEHPARHSPPSLPATVALAKPAEEPVVAPSTPAPATPPAVAPAPTPPPPAAPTPAPTTRVIAAAQPRPATTTTKTFGHSHPRGHAWGHVKHAVTPLPAGDPQGDDAQSQEPIPAPTPPAAAPPAAQPSSDDGNGNGNGNGHAWGHSKQGNGN
jgi:hypothetical protein